MRRCCASAFQTPAAVSSAPCRRCGGAATSPSGAAVAALSCTARANHEQQTADTSSGNGNTASADRGDHRGDDDKFNNDDRSGGKLFSAAMGTVVGAGIGVALLSSGVVDRWIGVQPPPSVVVVEEQSVSGDASSSNSNAAASTDDNGSKPSAEQKTKKNSKKKMPFGPQSQPKKPLPPPQDRKFTLQELMENYGGDKDPEVVYVAVKGIVYQVDPEMYGPKGYPFGGIDASRCLGKALLNRKEGNADWRTLGKANLEALDNWEDFFKNKYPVMGTIIEDEHFTERGKMFAP